MSEKKTRIHVHVNNDITAPRVRLIDAEGGQVGVVSLMEAKKLALEAQLDLVEIVPNGEPPVCRIMDYGKYTYQLSKKHNAAKKKQKQSKVKEVKFTPTTGEGDYQVKLRNLMRFLSQGDKTKISLRFRGREMTHQQLAQQIFVRIQQDLSEYGVVEQFPKLEGRQMIMVLSPKKG